MNHFFQDKKVLVTGGYGFVGRNLTSRLLEYGANIFVIDKCGDVYTGQPDIKFQQLDITKYQDVKSLIQTIRPHIIFHLAAIVTASRDFNLIDDMIEVNLRGTTNLLKAIEGIQELECMINFGTCEEYGNQAIQLDEELREEPSSPYAILKIATTRFCNMFSTMFKIPVTTVRPANIYGPGQPTDKFIPYVITKCLTNQSIDTTYGEQKRNLIFIDDFIDALLLIAEKERRPAQIYNIGAEESVSLRSVVELIKENTHSRSVINFGAISYRENEMMVFNLNINKSKALGWVPRYDLTEGLRRTIAFYQSAGDEQNE